MIPFQHKQLMKFQLVKVEMCSKFLTLNEAWSAVVNIKRQEFVKVIHTRKILEFVSLIVCNNVLCTHYIMLICIHENTLDTIGIL